MKALSLAAFTGGEMGCLGLASCGESGRDGFQEVVKMEAGLSAGGFTATRVHVWSSWVWLLSFKGITYLLLKIYQNYLHFNRVVTAMQKSCAWKEMSIFLVPQRVEKCLKYNTFLLF